MVEIQRLPQDRWKDYQQLRLESLSNEPIAFGSSYEEEITLSQKVWQRRIGDALFALIDDKPVGMLAIITSNRIKTKHIAEIFAMYVQPGYRNQGIGGQLIAKAIEIIKKNKDIRKINLTVNPGQEYAVKLYQKYGFNNVGTAKDQYYINGRYYDELLMERFI